MTLFITIEIDPSYIYMNGASATIRPIIARISDSFIKVKTPEMYHNMLIPDFDYDCKRVVIDDAGYLEGLHADNMTLSDEPVLEVEFSALRTRSGFTEADVIVLATGYETNNYPAGIEMVGRHGETISQHWDSLAALLSTIRFASTDFPTFL